MPERYPTTKPLIIAGTNIYSGTPNTGQQMMTQGGSMRYSSMSGAVGPDILIWTGGGRVDSITIHPPATAATGVAASGQPIILYDTGVAVSGGPLSTSGHVILAKISPAAEPLLGSPVFNSGLGLTDRVITGLGIPFFSGLCIATSSGRAGVTIGYTPVVSS